MSLYSCLKQFQPPISVRSSNQLFFFGDARRAILSMQHRPANRHTTRWDIWHKEGTTESVNVCSPSLRRLAHHSHYWIRRPTIAKYKRFGKSCFSQGNRIKTHKAMNISLRYSLSQAACRRLAFMPPFLVVFALRAFSVVEKWGEK